MKHLCAYLAIQSNRIVLFCINVNLVNTIYRYFFNLLLDSVSYCEEWVALLNSWGAKGLDEMAMFV